MRLGKNRYKLQIPLLSCVGGLLLGTGKLVLGLISASFFTCAGALYTYGVVLAKGTAWGGILNRKDRGWFALSGLILVISSLLYGVYSLRLFLRPEHQSFHLYTGIAIAAFTFGEIGFHVYGVLRFRRRKDFGFFVIKTINLASSLICLVLTQSALLSVASSESALHPRANGLLGICMSTVAAILGALIITQSRKGAKIHE